MRRQEKRLKGRDGNARIRSRIETAIIVVVSALGLMGLERAAHACSPPLPGIRARSVWPSGDRLPTNVRLVVHYDAFGVGPPAVPALGEDLALLDGTTVVPSTAELAGTDVVLRPLGPLLPDHTYQLADRRAVPCQNPAGTGDACGLVDALQPFATFVTGGGDDTTSPTFGGLTSIAIGRHHSCANDGCCGPYDSFSVHGTWTAGADGQDEAPLRYRIYHHQGAALTLVADNIDDTQMIGSLLCSGRNDGSLLLRPGRYLVRAFDGAGHEDSNAVEQLLVDPCGCACAVAATGAPSGWPVPSTAALLALSALILATRQRRRAITPAGKR